MKRFLLVFILPLLSISFLKAQPWNEGIITENPTFFEIQTAFENYWQGKIKDRGMGFNVYKRWEWYWEQRVGLSGEFPSPMHNYNEWLKFNQQLHRRTDFGANWRPLGPTTTPSGYNGLGRLNCIAFHPTDSNTFWVGSPSGGVWKTTDFGNNWTTTSDRNPVLGVSSIAVNPIHPDTLYAATGDGDRGSLWGMTGGPQGDNHSIGVIMSADGGATWQLTGLNWNVNEAKLIRTIIIHPEKPWILHCTASDGIWRSTNSGKDWTRVTGGYFMDMVYMPNNYEVIYATTFVTSGAGNARVAKSVDGGLTFEIAYTVANGGRLALGTTAARPELVHVLASHRTGGRYEGLYESLDTGKTFTKIHSAPNILANTHNGSGTSGQGWYDLTYSISQTNANICFVGGVNTWVSTNRGKNFSLRSIWANGVGAPGSVAVVHADKHHFVHHPLSPNTMFDCNDGGVYFTRNQGQTWTDISEGLDITQFYRIEISQSDTSIVLGGTQDNGARILRNGQWGEASGGDGMECGIDQFDPMLMYTTYARGVMYRSISGFTLGFDRTTISNNIPGRPTGAWVTPYKLDLKNSGTIFAGYNDVYKTTNTGNSWTRISTGLANGVLLRNIAIANNNSDVIYAGDYYGIHRTWDDGDNWQKLITTTTPITMVEVHPNNDSVFYYTHSSYSEGLKVMKYDGTELGEGKTINLSKNLPNVAINCLAILKGKEDCLFVGTDIGVFYLDNANAIWVPFMEGLPNVVVTTLKINYEANLLYAGTFGRGIWKSNIFQNTNPPLLTELFPIHEAEDVPVETDVKLKFNMPIIKGEGTLSFYYGDETSPFYSVNVKDPSVVIGTDSSVTIMLPENLKIGRKVSVRVPVGSIQGYNYLAFSGIAQQNWIFYTQGYFGGDISIDAFSVYPNPARDEMNVACINCPDLFDIKVHSLTGQFVLEQKDIEKTGKINVRGIGSGLYIVSFYYKDQRFAKSVLINVD